jgi:hypothetical protein
MSSITFVGDLVMDPETGKTWKDLNMELTHNIPIGSLVEIGHPEYPDYYDGVRLHVVKHGRDCDGEPLYWLSIAGKQSKCGKLSFNIFGGYSEGSLKVIAPPTEEVLEALREEEK